MKERPPYIFFSCMAAFLLMGFSGHLLPRQEYTSLIIEAPDTPQNKKKPPSVREIIIQAANSNGVPPEFALAVAEQESGLVPHRTGSSGEIGLFQLRCGLKDGKPLTAQVIGYRGKCKSLYDPTTNAYWGTLHLKLALDKSKGNWCKAAVLHNEGLGSPSKRSAYCRSVMERVAAL